MKVFKGNYDGLCCVVVAAKTKADAMRILGEPRHVFNEYYTEASGDLDVEVAMSEPGTLFWCSLHITNPTREDYYTTPGEARSVYYNRNKPNPL